MIKKIKKFYTYDYDGVSKPIKANYLVNSIIDGEIKSVGIFENSEEAEEQLTKYLSKGFCTWIVNNNEC
tara:strand:+ start:607 stop:813 length:207 start_codon:yes stop_codon:yes gene_type:complete